MTVDICQLWFARYGKLVIGCDELRTFPIHKLKYPVAIVSSEYSMWFYADFVPLILSLFFFIFFFIFFFSQ